MSVDFLAPKPIEDGSDLPSQRSRLKEEFELFITAAEKTTAGDKVKVAIILLRCIGPRENFKSFTSGKGESKRHIRIQLLGLTISVRNHKNKITRRYQLLSSKQSCLSLDVCIKLSA